MKKLITLTVMCFVAISTLAQEKAQNGGLAKITYTDDDGNEISAPVYDAQKMSLEPDYKKKK